MALRLEWSDLTYPKGKKELKTRKFITILDLKKKTLQCNPILIWLFYSYLIRERYIDGLLWWCRLLPLHNSYFPAEKVQQKRILQSKNVFTAFYNKQGVNINQLYVCNISILMCYFWGCPCIHMLISYICLKKRKHLWFLPHYLWISYLASVRIMRRWSYEYNEKYFSSELL